MDINSRLPPFAKRYPPCSSKDFKLMMDTAMTDPVMLLNKRVILFQMDEENDTFNFWFTDIKSILTDTHAYEGEAKPLLHLYTSVGIHTMEDLPRAVTIEVGQCFADFLPLLEAHPEEDKIPIPCNFYIYAFLSP